MMHVYFVFVQLYMARSVLTICVKCVGLYIHRNTFDVFIFTIVLWVQTIDHELSDYINVHNIIVNGKAT